MNIRLNWIICTGLPLLLAGCKHSSTTTFRSTDAISEIDIDINQLNDDSVFSKTDFIKPLKIIPLEVTDQSIFSKIEKIEKYDNRYFILDKNQSRRIYVFDDNGKFLQNIGKLGGGPGEYPEIQDFTINRKSGDVIIIGSPSDVYTYSSNGEFKGKKHVSDSYLWSIAWDGCGYLMTSDHWTFHEGEHSFLIYTFDDSFDCTGKWIHVLPMQPMGIFTNKSSLSHINNTTYYTDFCTNKIYQYKCGNDTVSTAFEFKFKTPIPDDVIDSFDKFMANQQRYDFLTSTVLTNDYILSTFVMSGNEFISVINQADGKIIRHGELRWGFLPSYHINDNTIVSYIIPSELTPGDLEYFNITDSGDDLIYLLEWEINLN